MDYPVNFTREPIIETVITPREGCHLAIRSSRGSGHEEYFVDAVEVVSFGQALFFRSQERPNSFLLPVSDYEVLELKEARMVLKNVAIDRSIKIGGGREPSPSRAPRESSDTENLEQGTSERPPMEQQRKRDNNKRRRGRRGGRPDTANAPVEGRASHPVEEPGAASLTSEDSGEGAPHKAPSFISKLFPPPPTLIKETLSRYKLAETPEESSSQTLEEKLGEPSLDDPNSFEPLVDTDEESSSEE